MRKIHGEAKNLRSLLGDAKFAIDYYQREYRWKKKQVAELIDDLVGKFLESYHDEDERTEVENYGHYFMGSIIISERESQKYIIDGQQRLTTLTLLLVHIRRLLKDDDQKGQVAKLICSTRYGRHSFNIDVKERNECMRALFAGETFERIEKEEQPDSVINILRRFQDLEDLLLDRLDDFSLPYFSDWLTENVHLIEITAYSDTDAYTIFETMNDRGLSLSPTDMLKGYLLAKIPDTDRRNEANSHWRSMISNLRGIDGKEGDSDAIKAWLRSQYAESIRERKKGSEPKDFDLIGTEFHRWVRDRKDDLGLSSKDDFARFIEEDFSFYGSWYLRLREAAQETKTGLESVYYCAQNNFTLQYPVLLASLRRADSESEQWRKLRIVSVYLDILIARRIWNWRSVGYSAMQYAMFQTIRDIRNKDAKSLANMLMSRLSEEQDFADNDRFHLHGNNRFKVHQLLARMTDYVETLSDRHSRYDEYMCRGGRKGYEVEHIWAANRFTHYSDEFAHSTDFAEYRNRIGCLLLLPKHFNASYGALPYEEKRRHYLKQNLLAQSLHEDAYERDPGFMRFMRNSGLEFIPHPRFRKQDLEKRQLLYTKIAEQIWSPERLAREVVAVPPVSNRL